MKTSHAPGRVSLPRAISKLGFASRSQACRLIEGGSVRVNNKVELNLHRWVDIEHDRIEIESQTLKREAFRYVILHKPRGVVTTSSDEHGERTVFDILGEENKGLRPVGRLDKETTGLLFFTNDHQLANRVTSPEVGLSKTYVASLDRPIRNSDLQVLSEGMEIRTEGEEVVTKPARVSVRQPLEVEISITEGKNRQVRKMLEELGYEVTGLRRIAVGPIMLRDLEQGESREMSVEEVNSLKSALGSKEIRKVSLKSPSRFQSRKAGGRKGAFGSNETKSAYSKAHARFENKRTDGRKNALGSTESKSADPKSRTRFQRKRTGGSTAAPWSKKNKPTYSKSHTRIQRKRTGGSHRKPSR
jgi:23S rRNA pseudouridine2605 synthase